MNVEKLYRDYGIHIASEGERHYREGWVNTECPFCSGNPGNHLGYDTQNDFFTCHRCGSKRKIEVISTLLNVSKQKAWDILTRYDNFVRKKSKKKVKNKPFTLPSNLTELKTNHRNYLIKRNFDPEEIIKKWNILGTEVYSKLEHFDYKHRIIIPYYWNGKIVTFDSRDITNKAKNKYYACPDDFEYIPRKSILYGRQEYWKETGICVEGALDVWRLGYAAFATSGIKYTSKQKREIAKHFKRIFIIFDNEWQAQRQASLLKDELSFYNKDVHLLTVDSDPANLSQKEANYLIKHLIK